jgi:L-asparaginase
LSSNLPNIAVFTLGGTIASVPNADGQNAVPTLSAAALFESVPQAKELAKLSTCSFRQYPSGDLSIEDIVELAGLIEKNSEGADGIVITQGTDTLEETSFLLDLLLTTDVPVVLTGAMRNPGLPGADGPANVLAALRVAAAEEARGIGPLVVLSDEIHLARFVRKMHSSSVSAFHSPNAGPVGWIGEGRVRIPLVPRHRTAPVPAPQHSASGFPGVALIKLGLGTDSGMIDLAVGGGYSGIVIESFGGGHVPGGMMKSLAAAAAKLPVVFTTRTGAGELYEATYGFPGSEKDLLNHGLLSAGVLDGPKARLLLTLLLAAGASRDELRRRFKESVS